MGGTGTGGGKETRRSEGGQWQRGAGAGGGSEDMAEQGQGRRGESGGRGLAKCVGRTSWKGPGNHAMVYGRARSSGCGRVSGGPQRGRAGEASATSLGVGNKGHTPDPPQQDPTALPGQWMWRLMGRCRACRCLGPQLVEVVAADNTSAASERVVAIAVLSQLERRAEVLDKIARALALCNRMPRLP